MTYSKTIICLANSKKTGGRCVAGKAVVDDGFGPWIRPISSRPTQELAPQERKYANGQDPDLLDIIEIKFVEPRPQTYQSENHLISTGTIGAKFVPPLGRKQLLQWTKFAGHFGRICTPVTTA